LQNFMKCIIIVLYIFISLFIVMKRVGKIFLSIVVIAWLAFNLFFATYTSQGKTYLDEKEFKVALNTIKDEIDFKITAWIEEGEYYFKVTNKQTGEYTISYILSQYNEAFRKYCSDVLGMYLWYLGNSWTSDTWKQKTGKVLDVQKHKVILIIWGWVTPRISTATGQYKLPTLSIPSGWWRDNTNQECKKFIWWATSGSWWIITWKTIDLTWDIILYAVWDNYPFKGYCPDWAICSSMFCQWYSHSFSRSYEAFKIDECQPGYELEDGVCKCKINSKTIKTDWTYKCVSVSKNTARLQIGITGSSLSSIDLDYEIAAKLGIPHNNPNYQIGKISVVWEDSNSIWRAPEDSNEVRVSDMVEKSGDIEISKCKEIGDEYFLGKVQEITIESSDYNGCFNGCKCTQWVNSWERNYTCPTEEYAYCEKYCLKWYDLSEQCLYYKSYKQSSKKGFEKSPDRICENYWFNLESCPNWYECDKVECESGMKFKINTKESCKNAWERWFNLKSCPEWSECEELKCDDGIKYRLHIVCEKNWEQWFELESCPKWAMCSSAICNNVTRFKIDKCQPGYELEHGVCECKTHSTSTIKTDGTYKCVCPYTNYCWLDVGITGDRWSNTIRLGYDLARAVGIPHNNPNYTIVSYGSEENIMWEDGSSIWRVPAFLNGAGKVISVLEEYLEKTTCKEIGDKYFSGNVQEITIESSKYDGCYDGCKCSDWNDCPLEELTKCRTSCNRGLDLSEQCLNSKNNKSNSRGFNNEALTFDSTTCKIYWFDLDRCPQWYECDMVRCGNDEKYRVNTEKSSGEVWEKWFNLDSCPEWYAMNNGECVDKTVVDNNPWEWTISFSEDGLKWSKGSTKSGDTPYSPYKATFRVNPEDGKSAKKIELYAKVIIIDKLGGIYSTWNVDKYFNNRGDKPIDAKIFLERDKDDPYLWNLLVDFEPADIIYSTDYSDIVSPRGEEFFKIEITNNIDDSKITLKFNQEIDHYFTLSSDDKSVQSIINRREADADSKGATYWPFKLTWIWDDENCWTYDVTTSTPSWIHIDRKNNDTFYLRIDSYNKQTGKSLPSWRNWYIYIKWTCDTGKIKYERYGGNNRYYKFDYGALRSNIFPSSIMIWQKIGEASNNEISNNSTEESSWWMSQSWSNNSWWVTSLNGTKNSWMSQSRSNDLWWGVSLSRSNNSWWTLLSWSNSSWWVSLRMRI